MVADVDVVENEIPLKVRQVFGDEKARPKVVRTYEVQSGWSTNSKSPTLTWQTVDDLLKCGKTSVELKWRFKRHQVSLLDLRPRAPRVERGRRSDSRAAPTQAE